MKSLLGVLLLGLLFVGIQRLPEGESRHSADTGRLEPYQTPPNPAGFHLLRLAKSTHRTAVLFIPGHRGHANQVLPLAEQINEVDVYVTDFNEAPTALSPDLLGLEAAFIRASLSLLLSQYQGQVALVAHSMGGVAASLALTDLNPAPQLFLSLSCPLEQHPLGVNTNYIHIYNRIHAYWKQKPVPFLAVSGGIGDLLVPAPLASLSELPGRLLYTSQLEGGLATDHLAVLWSPRVLFVLRNSIYEHLLGTENSPPGTAETALLAAEVQCQLGEWPEGVRENMPVSGLSVLPGLYEHVGNETEVLVIGGKLDFIRKRISGMAQICAGQRAIFGSEVVSVFKIAQFDLIRAESPIFLQEIHSIRAYPSLFFLLFTSQTYESEFRATKLDIFGVFSARFPAKIHFSAPTFLLVRCNSQYLFYPPVQEVTLWLREDCGKALNLFVFTEKDVILSISVTVDVLGVVLLRWVDLRLALCTYGAARVLGTSYSLWAGLGVVWLAGDLLRSVGFLTFDHIHRQFLTLGVLDLVFLAAVAELIDTLIAFLARIFTVIQAKIAVYLPNLEFSRRFLLISSIISMIFPWMAVLSVVLVSFHCFISNQRALLRLCWLHLLLDFPQILAWTLYYLPPWRLFDLSLSLSLFSLHLTLSCLLSLRKADNIQGFLTATGLYLALCCYDLLYRVSAAVFVCEVGICLVVLCRPKRSLS